MVTMRIALLALLLAVPAIAEDDLDPREAQLGALATRYQDAVREEQEAVQAKETMLRKRCGKDYARVRVGMSFDRVRLCAGDFELKAQDGSGSIYEAEGGFVRVEHGRVTKWIAK